MTKAMKTFSITLAALAVACGGGSSSGPSRKVLSTQGFEADTSGWIATADPGVARVASNGGTLAIPASSGGYYAEILNQHDGYTDADGNPQIGYGDAGHSYFGAKGTEYKGAFYQAIDVYIDKDWAVAANPGADSFWIDMAANTAADVGAAEHNFHLRATGSSVEVRADAATDPLLTITTSGWYTFVITFEKGAADADPVVSHLKVLKGATVLGEANAEASDLASADLLGNRYVWITLWQNGFADDVLAIDNVETGLLPY
jgi:hypothetical protein